MTAVTATNLFDAVFATIPADFALFPEEEGGGALSLFAPDESKSHLPTGGEEVQQEQDEAVAAFYGAATRPTRVAASTAAAAAPVQLELDDEDDAVREARRVGEQFLAALDGDETDAAEARSVARRAAPASSDANAAAAARRNAVSAVDQIAAMPPDGEQFYFGACVLYNQGKGFGFITPDVGGPDIYFSRDALLLSHATAILAEQKDGGVDENDEEEEDDPLRRRRRVAQLMLADRRVVVVRSGERLQFRVTRNGANESRRLRALEITAPGGAPIAFELAMLGSGASAAAAAPRQLGVVRNFSLEAGRGYIRPNAAAASNGGDVVVTPEAVVWANRVPLADRVLVNGAVVEYTIADRDRTGKPVAAVVTAPKLAPLDPFLFPRPTAAAPSAADHHLANADADDGILSLRNAEVLPGGGEANAAAARKRDRAAAAADEVLALEDDAYAVW